MNRHMCLERKQSQEKQLFTPSQPFTACFYKLSIKSAVARHYRQPRYLVIKDLCLTWFKSVIETGYLCPAAPSIRRPAFGRLPNFKT